MAEGDSINAYRPGAHRLSTHDRELMKRLTAVVLFVFVFTGAFAYLDRVYSRKFLDITGEAKWIWAQHRMSAETPLAFFATRAFDLPETRLFTHLKILGDPEYAVYLNGQMIGSRYVGEDRTLDVYDVSSIARTGRNQLLIAVRAPKGTGGLIAAIDIAPEIANFVVSDESWRIHRYWTPSLLTPEPVARWETPLIIGEPPYGRWNYLTQRPQELLEPPAGVILPKRELEVVGLMPTISTRSGVAVAGSEKRPATVFEFGPVRGQLRVRLDAPRPVAHSVPVRFVNHPDELGFAAAIQRYVVFAPGETVVTIPETYEFNFAMLFDRGVDAAVVRDPPSK